MTVQHPGIYTAFIWKYSHLADCKHVMNQLMAEFTLARKHLICLYAGQSFKAVLFHIEI